MTSLRGQSVLITGASRGIGRAVAVAFADTGAAVAVRYGMDAGAAEQTREMLAPGDHLVIGADLHDPDEAARLVDDVSGHYGRLDVLVNNAGVYLDHPVPIPAQLTPAGATPSCLSSVGAEEVQR